MHTHLRAHVTGGADPRQRATARNLRALARGPGTDIDGTSEVFTCCHAQCTLSRPGYCATAICQGGWLPRVPRRATLPSSERATIIVAVGRSVVQRAVRRAESGPSCRERCRARRRTAHTRRAGRICADPRGRAVAAGHAISEDRRVRISPAGGGGRTTRRRPAAQQARSDRRGGTAGDIFGTCRRCAPCCGVQGR
mgnify:CR=1 FL=1